MRRASSKATLGDRSFTCAAPKLWNALPFDIRSASTVSIFKAKLKTHLFRHALLSWLFFIVSLLLIVILAFWIFWIEWFYHLKTKPQQKN